MSSVDAVSPVKPSRAGYIAKLALAGLAGVGVAGGGAGVVYNQITTNQDQANRVERLSDQLTQYQTASSQHQSTIDAQHQSTIDALNARLQQGQQSIQSMLAQVNALNRDLSSRITLDQLVGVVSRTTPHTVRVEGARGLGSGVIIRDNNGGRYILTNGHVTQGNDFRRNGEQDGVYHIKIYNGRDSVAPVEFDAAPVMLANGQRAFATPETHDLALLAIPPNVQIPANLGITMRDMTVDPIRPGEPLIAIGNPFGERDSVSFGIASHVDRRTEGLNQNMSIQTDAAINPGNSGGALVDMQGRLVGINTWGYRGGASVGGAIRIDYVKRVLESWGLNVMNPREREIVNRTVTLVNNPGGVGSNTSPVMPHAKE